MRAAASVLFSLPYSFWDTFNVIKVSANVSASGPESACTQTHYIGKHLVNSRATPRGSRDFSNSVCCTLLYPVLSFSELSDFSPLSGSSTQYYLLFFLSPLPALSSCEFVCLLKICLLSLLSLCRCPIMSHHQSHLDPST